MPLELDRFIKVRPRLFHLTAKSNIELIRRAGRLGSAAELLRASGNRALIRERRRTSLIVPVEGRDVHIRDQAPLHSGNMALSDGWQLADFVAYLNEHVFFWPGTLEGPIEYGRRHFERYRGQDNRVLVLDTAAVFAANIRPGAKFCRYNSGSPRCTGGRPSPRGPSTFQEAHAFTGTPSNIVEVVFRGSVALPEGRMVIVDPDNI